MKPLLVQLVRLFTAWISYASCISSSKFLSNDGNLAVESRSSNAVKNKRYPNEVYSGGILPKESFIRSGKNENAESRRLEANQHHLRKPEEALTAIPSNIRMQLAEILNELSTNLSLLMKFYQTLEGTEAGLTKSASCLWYALTLITFVIWTGLLAFKMRVSRFLSKGLTQNRHGWALVCNNFKLAGPYFTSRVGVRASCSTEQLPGGGCMHSVETREATVDLLQDCLAWLSPVDLQDSDGLTALMKATSYGQVEVVRLLLDRGAQIDLQDSDGLTALMKAAYNGQVEVVRLLLDRRAQIDLQDSDGSTALMLAARHGQVEVVRLLLDRGAQIDLQDSESGSTALMQATMEVVRLLLDRGAQTDLQDSIGYTALMRAAYYGQVEVVLLLLDRGAQIDLQDSDDGLTALMKAAYNGQVEVVHLLLDRGAQIDLQDRFGSTALMQAAGNGQVEVVRLLLDRGAQIDLQDSLVGYTALMEAAEYGYISVCKMLVQHSANLTLKDSQNETALAKAKKRAHSDIAAFLAEKLGMEEEAKYLAEGRFHTVYVCERERFLRLPRLIKCEVARERGIVRELRPDDLNKRIAFTSHRWLRGSETEHPSEEQKQTMERSRLLTQELGYTEKQAPMEPHPDDYENLKLKGFQDALQLGELVGVELIWMDYLCIPQDDLFLQLLAINTLSYTVCLCSDFVVLHNENTGIKNFHHQNLDEGSWEVYNSRGWCRLECLSASAPKQSGEQIKKWKCSYSIGKVEIEPLNFSSVSVFNPYEGEFVDSKDMERIALMVYKLGERLADTYSNVDLAELMKAAYANMPNKEMKKRYEEDLKRFS